jgi:hypothetical protein
MGGDSKKRKRINWEKVLTLKNIVITLLFSLSLCLGSFFLLPDDESVSSTAGSYLFLFGILIGLIGTIFSSTFLVIVAIKVFANAAAEVQREQEAKEEERLAKIRASMTPAEWETYKIQPENNKLLKNIQRNNNSKNTTTTIGFVE